MNTNPTNNPLNIGLSGQSTPGSYPPVYSASPAPNTPVLPGAQRALPAKAHHRQITRNRASYSCHTCRRRKVKCDKVHPICGNCIKNGTECVYDVAPHKGSADQASSSKNGGHGVKRRRETSRPLEEETIDDLQSIYGHLKQSGTGDSKSGSQAIEARLDKLTSMIERLSKSNQPLDPADRQFLDSAKGDVRIPSSNGQSASILKPQPASHPDSPRRTADSSGDEFPIPSGQATDLVDPVGSLNLGHLSLEDGGRSRYVGTTYWAYISDEINELNQLLRDQTRSHNTDAPTDGTPPDEIMPDPLTRTPGSQWRSSVDSHAGFPGGRMSTGEAFQKSVMFPSTGSPSVHEQVVEPEMLDNVPTKRQSHILYRGFMSGVHAISPVVHPPTILKLYNSFWEWYDYSSYSGESCPDPSFIPLLYAIWYGGSVTVSIRTIKAEFNAASRFALSKTFNEEVTRWLTKISFPRSPSLQGLAAYLLVQTILSKEEEPLTSSLFISFAMRVAQTMGLHRDPAKFGIQPYEAEYRRRIWWHIVHMDGVVAMSSGLPPLVSDENFWDVRDASEVKDTLLGSPEAAKYEEMVAAGVRSPDTPDDPTVCGGPSMVNVYYLSARGKYVMARAVRRILKIQLGTKPVTRRDMEELRSILLDLQLKLNSIVNRIPEGNLQEVSPGSSNRSKSFSRSPGDTQTSDNELPGEGHAGCLEQYHTPVLVSFHKWARILLSLFIDKAFCVAYQPFLKNAKSRIWPAARHSALRHCHGFMEKFISLATDPDFQPFQWSWPGNHQPMHAAMIMLIDLYERPHSPEAPKSRAFIDRIFSLTGPDGGVVGGEDGISTQRPLKDGGREAWDMIRRLRQKAWQKAGLDPHKLWTEQAQIQAGVATSVDDYPCASDPYYNNLTTVGTPAGLPHASRGQLTDFSKMFYNMTRSHQLPNPVSTLRPSPLRHEMPSPADSAPSTSTGTPQSAPRNVSTSTASTSTPGSTLQPPSMPSFSQSPATTNLSSESTTTGPGDSSISTPENLPQYNPNLPFTNTQPANTFSTPPIPAMPYMDPVSISPATQPMAMPTPPSMMDPNLNFDWDQWDAVFGQHLPVADELMELDPVTGFEFGDLGGPQYPRGPPSNSSFPGAPSDGVGGMPGPDWTGYC